MLNPFWVIFIKLLYPYDYRVYNTVFTIQCVIKICNVPENFRTFVTSG